MKFIAAILILIFINSAWAVDCNSNAEMEKCSQDRYHGHDDELNVTYGKLSRSVSGNVRTDLRAAQRAWIVYRDATCNDAGDTSKFGKEVNLEKISCLDRMTEVRQMQLDYLSGKRSLIGFVSFINLNASLKNQSQSYTVNELNERRPDGKDKIWDLNVSSFCKVSNDMRRENENFCKAGLIFYDFY